MANEKYNGSQSLKHEACKDEMVKDKYDDPKSLSKRSLKAKWLKVTSYAKMIPFISYG